MNGFMVGAPGPSRVGLEILYDIDRHYATREEESDAATGSNRAFRHERLFQNELKGA
jgi:hypothetical protein